MSGFAMLLASLAAAPIAPTPNCTVPPGWSEVINPNAHYVIFGETHGSAESPTAMGEIACAFAKRQERLLVGVELSSTEDAGLQRAWALPHAQFAAALLREMPEWATRNDGVTSAAMLALLVRLHALKSAGRSIDVVAFNGVRDAAQAERFKTLPGQGPHEAAQADNIRIADRLRPHDRVLILIGSFHARKKPRAAGGVAYEPMAMRLDDPARIVSLYLASGGGASWNCQIKGPFPADGRITSDMLSCGAHGGRAEVDWSGPPRLVDTAKSPGPANPDGAYDATFFIGPITASPPAVAQR